MSGSYIGKNPQYGFFEKQRITTANGVLTAFNLAFTTADSAQLLVSVAGVIQEPGQAYTVLSGTPQQISFTEAPATGVDIFIIWMGKELTGPRFGSAMLTDQAAITSLDPTDDFLVYDATASTLKKVNYQYVHSGVADMAANTVKVRDANSTGAPSDKAVATTEILIGNGTGFTSAALSGDITMTNAGVTAIGTDKVVTASILDDNVTYGKMQDTATNNRVLGAVTAGTVGEVQIATDMIADNAVSLAKLSDGTQGGTIYYGASGAPTELAAGTSGYFLKTLGGGVNPAWAEVPAGAPTGGGTDKVFFENEQSVDTDYTVTSGYNAVTAGPCVVASGVTVTLTGTSAWVIV